MLRTGAQLYTIKCNARSLYAKCVTLGWPSGMALLAAAAALMITLIVGQSSSAWAQDSVTDQDDYSSDTSQPDGYFDSDDDMLDSFNTLDDGYKSYEEKEQQLDSLELPNLLSDAIVRAYRNSPVILSKKGEIESARAAVKRAVQGNYMTLAGIGRGNGTVTWSRSRSINTQLRETSTPFQVELGVRGTKPIYDRSKEVQVRQAEHNLLVQSVTLDSSVQTLVQSVVLAYAAAYYNNKAEELYIDAVSSLEDLLQSAEDRFSAGQITKVEVAEARATLASQRSELLSTRNIVSQNLNILEQLTKRSYDSKSLEDPTIESPPIIESPEDAIAMALQRNYDIRLARANAETARLAIAFAEASRYIKFNLIGEARQSIPIKFNSGSFNTVFSLGIESVFNFYDGGVGSSAVQSAILNHQVALSRVNNAKDNAERNARSNFDTINSASLRVDAAKIELDSYRLALEGVREAEASGVKSLTDVLEASRRFILSNIRLISAQYNFTSQRLSALLALGVFDVNYVNNLSGGLIEVPNFNIVDEQQYLRQHEVNWDDRDFSSHTLPTSLDE